MNRAQLFLLLIAMAPQAGTQEARPRARDIGLRPGTLPTGPVNAITDVAGVRVGHATLLRGESIRTGVTAIVPHGGNLFQRKVTAAIFTGNGFGKLVGSTQVNELGEIETPILLTNTLNVPRVADALLDYMLSLPGNENARSINPLVGETNDGYLNDIRARAVGRAEVLAAIRGARPGEVEEGAVGAGTGTMAFGWKGGIGTASRKTPAGHMVGVLVQSNFGGDLMICGVPVGRQLRAARPMAGGGVSMMDAGGSILMVVATDAPLDHLRLRRMAARTMMGLARTGASGHGGSGDYAIAFTTSEGGQPVANQDMSPLFLAVIEATEEAIYNSLLRARSMTGFQGHRVEALPVGAVTDILRRHGAIR